MTPLSTYAAGMALSFTGGAALILWGNGDPRGSVYGLVCSGLVIVAYILGRIEGREMERKERRDEASQFSKGDRITFGDRSAIVVVTLPPEGDE